MPFDARAVANQFLDLAKADGVPLTPMKLQKLVYFAHGWCLAVRRGFPLIDEQVEARPYGPVIPSLDRALRAYGNEPVTDPIPRSRGDIAPSIPSLADIPEEESFARSLIQRIWELYGPYTAVQLSNMTHEPGSPWDQVHREYTAAGGRIPRGTDIPRQAIREYFAKRPQGEVRVNEGEAAGLGEITGPNPPPPDQVDPLTRKELERARAKPLRPSPGDRHASSVESHINDLRDELTRLRDANASLQGRLDELLPEHAALRESYRASLANAVFSSALIGLGGALISGVGYAPDPWKLAILGLGIGMFGCGFVLQVAATWLAALFRPSRPIPAVPPQPVSTSTPPTR